MAAVEDAAAAASAALAEEAARWRRRLAGESDGDARAGDGFGDFLCSGAGSPPRVRAGWPLEDRPNADCLRGRSLCMMVASVQRCLGWSEL